MSTFASLFLSSRLPAAQKIPTIFPLVRLTPGIRRVSNSSQNLFSLPLDQKVDIPRQRKRHRDRQRKSPSLNSVLSTEAPNGASQDTSTTRKLPYASASGVTQHLVGEKPTAMNIAKHFEIAHRKRRSRQTERTTRDGHMTPSLAVPRFKATGARITSKNRSSTGKTNKKRTNYSQRWLRQP